MILEYQYLNFKIKIEVLNANSTELEVIKKAALGMCYALGHPKFKEFCLNYSYEIKYYKWVGLKKKYTYKKFKQFYKSNGKTNHQVYNHVMSGQELCPDITDIDYEADVFLKIDRRNKPGVIGWTKKSIKFQYIYEWVFKRKDWKYIAGNLTHEWLHKLDYSHSPTKNVHRKHTPTYAIGNYVRKFLYDRSLPIDEI